MDDDLACDLSRRRDDVVQVVRQTATMLHDEVRLADWEYLATLPSSLASHQDAHRFAAPLEVIHGAFGELLPMLYIVAPQLESMNETELLRRPIQSKSDLLSALEAIASDVAGVIAALPVKRLKASVRSQTPRERHRGIEFVERGARWFYLHTRELVSSLRRMRGVSPEPPFAWPGPRPPEEIQYPSL